jgi:hypothetical protein
MQAMGAPVLSHLDPDMMKALDEVRERLGRAFLAADGAFSLAVSGTGTSGMEAAVANVTRPGSSRARRRRWLLRRSPRADLRAVRRRGKFGCRSSGAAPAIRLMWNAR